MEGPLRGERIAILGEPRDGALARYLAGAGARVVASVGVTTTMLVISALQPFGRWANASVPYRKAEELRSRGQVISILSEDALRNRLSAADVEVDQMSRSR